MAIGTHQLVGREEELASLVGLLAAPGDGPAAGVVVGEAGIGKTALWRQAVEEAAARDYLVLSSRPTETEAGFSFSGLADLLGGIVGDVLPGLPGPQRRALEAALALSEDAPAEEGVVAFAFLNTLRRLAEASRVVLAVDDVQWLDEPSLALLRYGVPRLETEPVVVLLTARGQAPGWLPEAVSGKRLVELDLAPLSLGALHELLRRRLDAGFPRPVLLRLWRASGGNPFYALELARALERRGGRIEPGTELPVPPTLEELVQERLETLTPEAEEACRVVASSSEPTLQLVRLAVERGDDGIDHAVRARVLELDGDRVRFTHPLLASAVSARTTGERRRVLHDRLAGLAFEPEERARHLALAASGPSARVAATLDGAAHRARVRGAPSAAAELAEQALRLTPPGDDEARRRRTLDVADLHFQAGDVEHALGVLERALDEAPSGPERGALLLRLGRLRAETSGAEEAVAVFREALPEAAGDAALEARILLGLGEFLRFTEGAEQGLVHLEAAVQAAAHVDDDELRCRALAAHSLLHFNAGRGVLREEIEQALALEASLSRRDLSMTATPFHVHQLFWSGELARAREALGAWRAWARARDHPDAADASWYLALLEWRAGAWDAAAEAAAAAAALSEQFGRESATIASWPGAIVAAHRGEVDQARALAERGLAAHGRPRLAIAAFGWVLGHVDLSRGDFRGALEHLGRADEVVSALGLLEPAMQWYQPDLLDALLGTGDVDRAEATVAAWEARARTLDRAWALAIAARTRALVHAARGDLEGSFASFGEALAQHDRTQDPFQHARTLLALGATQRRAKRRAAARTTLEQALGAFERLGAPLWAAKAEAELARIGGRAPSRGELTESELRIAALVAEGRTNREVAAALFLTDHTVETTLSRVYRKLGLRSRTELAGRLARESQERTVSKS